LCPEIYKRNRTHLALIPLDPTESRSVEEADEELRLGIARAFEISLRVVNDMLRAQVRSDKPTLYAS
jgi:hypothetical protein